MSNKNGLSYHRFLFTFLCIFAPTLQAVPPCPFFHKIQVSTLENNSEKPEYLIHFNIDKVVASEVLVFTRPVVHCVEGEESIISKSVNGNGYTIKALVYKAEGRAMLKTFLEVHEGEVVVYNDNDDCELGTYQHG